MKRSNHSLAHLCSLAVFLFLILFSRADVSAQATNNSYACTLERQLVCQLVDSAYIGELITRYPFNVVSYLHELGAYLVCVDSGESVDDIISQTELDTLIIACHRNYEFDLPEVVQGSQPFVDRPGDENRFTEQSAAANLNLPLVDQTPIANSVKVGVIDVGVDLGHPALSGSVVSGPDLVSGDTNSQDEPDGSASGHGTFIAGLIRRVAPQAEVHAYRVLDTNGRGTGWSVAQAMINAIDNGCKVINLSLVMHEKHSAVDAAIEYARTQNVVVVAAAGNDNSSVERFPAGDSYVLSVTGVDSVSKKPDFANYGNYLDVCAPAVNLYSLFPDSAHATWSGTSFAAPIVAAQAAWLFSLKPDATWDEVMDAIRSTAVNIDSANPNLPQGSLGNGLVDIHASFAALGLICGDIDGSGTVTDVGDLTILVDHLFISFGVLPNIAIANVDGQAGVDIGDLTALVDHLFITLSPIHCGW